MPLFASSWMMDNIPASALDIASALDMASFSPQSQAMGALSQPLWIHLQRIYQASHRLLTKVTNLSTPTEEGLASIQKTSTGLRVAIGAISSDVPVFSSTLASRLESLESSLPRYLVWLSDVLNDRPTIPIPDPYASKECIVGLLTSILAEFPTPDDEDAWTAVLTDFETLHCWNRRRELECELRHLRAQVSRKPTEQSSSSPRLGDLIRELDSLPKVLSLSCTPGLRMRLLDCEEHEAKWEKAAEERRRVDSREKAHREAMEVFRTMYQECNHDELATVLQHAAAREKATQARRGVISLCDRDLTTRAWNILRRLAFLDCVAPVAGASAPVMPPPSFDVTQHGVSLDFLMKTLNNENRLEALRNKVAIRELVDESLLTLHDEFKPAQRYTMAAGTQFALRLRGVVDSLEPANRSKSYCDKALIETAADIRRICLAAEFTSESNRRLLEAVRHARVLIDVSNITWIQLKWHNLYGSWQFVAKLVEECEAKVGQC